MRKLLQEGRAIEMFERCGHGGMPLRIVLFIGWHLVRLEMFGRGGHAGIIFRQLGLDRGVCAFVVFASDSLQHVF